MIDTYNIDFLIAGLVLVCAIGIHYIYNNRHAHDAKSKIFLLCLAVVFVDLVTEIITCSPAITYASAFPLWSLYALNVIFLIAQSSICFLFFLYAAHLAKRLVPSNKVIICLASVPYIACLLLVLTTPLTNELFSIDPVTHAYTTMTSMYAMYIEAGFYALAGLCVTVPQRSIIRRIDFYAILEFFVMLVLFTTLQLALHHVQLSGFGAAIGMLLFFTSINNPCVIIDPLTGLFENTRFRRCLARLNGCDEKFDVVFVTMDFLHELSPLVSSELLDATVVQTANALSKAAGRRPAYRIKPTVFAVIALSRHERKHIIDGMNAFFDQPHHVGDAPVTLNAHIGYIPHNSNAKDDALTYEYVEYVVTAVKRGRLDLGTTTREDLTTEYERKKIVRTCIDDAIREDLFTTCLQPIYNLQSRSFNTAEALLRLNHPTVGFISPGEFIPMAEQDGSINEIARSHFRRLCRIWKEDGEHLRQLGIQNIKVNVSAVELMKPDLGDFFLSTMDDFGVKPDCFEFEITETAAANYDSEVLSLADRLHEEGSRLAMDDFGSGYANFDSVLCLPFDTVKMDSSLLFKADEDPRAEKMYRYLLQMLTDLQYHTVCEGVETVEQARKLQAWGAHSLQGFLFAHPTDVRQLIGLKSLPDPSEILQDAKA